VHLPKGFFFLKTPKLGVLKCEEFDLEYNEILSNQKVFLEPEWGGVLSTKKKKNKNFGTKIKCSFEKHELNNIS
jgi:hypothetical protein